MELQVVGFGAAPWKSKIISVNDSSAALRRGDGRGVVSCFEAEEIMKKKKKNVAYKYMKNSEDAQDDNTHSSSSSMLLVWSGQPNEDDDHNQPSKRLKPSCPAFVNLNLNKDDGEAGPSDDDVVGWPPIKSWRKKLLYQHHAPHHRHENNARRVRGRKNMEYET